LLLGNGHSASAAEIMILALKEGAGIPLMGLKTYGKGVGQTVRTTPGHGLALVTFLKFTGASGLDYHKKGIEPDYSDSTSGDSLLVHATVKAKTLLGKPAAKLSASDYALRHSELVSRAALIEWNRRQAIRSSNKEFDPL
jgi:C-terminal processing protease CtpA/Prc